MPTLSNVQPRRVTIVKCQGEYRVPGPSGTEAQAYYATDRDDADASARSMWNDPALCIVHRTNNNADWS